MNNLSKTRKTVNMTLSWWEAGIVLAMRSHLAKNAFAAIGHGAVHISLADFVPVSVKVEIIDKCSSITTELDELLEKQKGQV